MSRRCGAGEGDRREQIRRRRRASRRRHPVLEKSAKRTRGRHRLSLEVWKVDLTQIEREFTRFERVLSTDEAERARNMANEAARRRFVTGRGCLRHLLAERLGVAPREIRLSYTSAGKPRLDEAVHGEARARPFEFSLSHSADIVVAAICEGDVHSDALGRGLASEVGVDVEWTGRRLNRDGVVRRFGTPSEQREYCDLAPGCREAAFYRWWTRKEALLKAAGVSLARGLGAVSIPFGEERHLEVDTEAFGRPRHGDPHRRWSLATLTLDSRFVLSIARSTSPGESRARFLDFSKDAHRRSHQDLPLTLVARW